MDSREEQCEQASSRSELSLLSSEPVKEGCVDGAHGSQTQCAAVQYLRCPQGELTQMKDTPTLRLK